MNSPLNARGQRDGGNRAALAFRNRDAEHLNSTEALKTLQVRRLSAIFGCADATVLTLAFLVYGEGRQR